MSTVPRHWAAMSGRIKICNVFVNRVTRPVEKSIVCLMRVGDPKISTDRNCSVKRRSNNIIGLATSPAFSVARGTTKAVC